MTEIPDDVMKAAMKAVTNGFIGVEAVALAILAERERCIAIAVEAHDEWASDAVLWEKEGMKNASKNSSQMANACAIIAGRINNS